MNFSRRKAMGVALGGAVAGPSMVKEAASQMRLPPTPADYVAPEMGYASEAKLAQSKMHDAQELAKLRRIAAGEILDSDRNYPTEGPPEPYRYLRSVSEEAKSFMRTRHYERRWRQRTIENAKKALEEYDKTGFLRYIW